MVVESSSRDSDGFPSNAAAPSLRSKIKQTIRLQCAQLIRLFDLIAASSSERSSARGKVAGVLGTRYKTLLDTISARSRAIRRVAGIGEKTLRGTQPGVVGRPRSGVDLRLRQRHDRILLNEATRKQGSLGVNLVRRVGRVDTLLRSLLSQVAEQRERQSRIAELKKEIQEQNEKLSAVADVLSRAHDMLCRGLYDVAPTLRAMRNSEPMVVGDVIAYAERIAGINSAPPDFDDSVRDVSIRAPFPMPGDWPKSVLYDHVAAVERRRLEGELSAAGGSSVGSPEDGALPGTPSREGAMSFLATPTGDRLGGFSGTAGAAADNPFGAFREGDVDMSLLQFVVNPIGDDEEDEDSEDFDDEDEDEDGSGEDMQVDDGAAADSPPAASAADSARTLGDGVVLSATKKEKKKKKTSPTSEEEEEEVNKDPLSLLSFELLGGGEDDEEDEDDDGGDDDDGEDGDSSDILDSLMDML